MTSYGKIGVKAWVYRGDIMSAKEVQEAGRVKSGQWVNAGDLVVTLDNSEVVEALRVAEAVREQAKVRFSALGSSMSWEVRQMGAQAAQEMELAETGYRIAAARAAKLQLRATMAGYVLTPNVEQLVGSFAAPQMTVIRLGDTRQLRLLVALTEKDAQLVSEGARVTGWWVGSVRSLETHLDAVSSQPAKPNDILYGMLSFYGGTVPSDALRSDARTRSHFPVFLATAPLPNPEHAVPEGLRLKVTIEGKETTLGRKIWRWFMSLFDLRTSGLPG
jgi:multidrug efflux pump subunit AcrA (membrane-fusion protein)